MTQLNRDIKQAFDPEMTEIIVNQNHRDLNALAYVIEHAASNGNGVPATPHGRSNLNAWQILADDRLTFNHLGKRRPSARMSPAAKLLRDNPKALTDALAHHLDEDDAKCILAPDFAGGQESRLLLSVDGVSDMGDAEHVREIEAFLLEHDILISQVFTVPLQPMGIIGYKLIAEKTPQTDNNAKPPMTIDIKVDVCRGYGYNFIILNDGISTAIVASPQQEALLALRQLRSRKSPLADVLQNTEYAEIDENEEVMESLENEVEEGFIGPEMAQPVKRVTDLAEKDILELGFRRTLQYGMIIYSHPAGLHIVGGNPRRAVIDNKPAQLIMDTNPTHPSMGVSRLAEDKVERIVEFCCEKLEQIDELIQAVTDSPSSANEGILSGMTIS